MRVKGKKSFDPNGGHRELESEQNYRRITRLSATQEVQAGHNQDDFDLDSLIRYKGYMESNEWDRFNVAFRLVIPGQIFNICNPLVVADASQDLLKYQPEVQIDSHPNRDTDSWLTDSEDSYESSNSESEEEIALIDTNGPPVVDAFKRVRVGPMSPWIVIPVVISDVDGIIQTKDKETVEDTNSATVSLEIGDANDGRVEDSNAVSSKTPPNLVTKGPLRFNDADVRKQEKKRSQDSSLGSPLKKSRLKDSNLSTWYPGFDVGYGLGYISPSSLQCFSPPAPIIYNTSKRWKASSWSQKMLPKFSKDDLKASIEYLRYAAVFAGTLPSPAAQDQIKLYPQMEKYQKMLMNIMSIHKDLENVDIVKDKLSSRASKKVSPLIFSPEIRLDSLSAALKHERSLKKKTSTVEGDPSAASDVRWGTQFQAVLPPANAMLTEKQKTERENRLGGTRIIKAHIYDMIRDTKIDSKRMEVLDPQKVSKELSKKTESLLKTLGAETGKHLGLGTMGSITANKLTPHQQKMFGQGMTKHGRNFQKIREEFLPDVSCCTMAEYYYDVWKLKAVPAAKKWYQQKERKKTSQG